MDELKNIIIGRIKAEGPISFRDYMDMALYWPEMGYYTSGAVSIGRDGDFYTSPHHHSMFGHMLGRQVVEMAGALEGGELVLLEMGAGRGYMALDILDCLKGRPEYDRLSYLIVEKGPELAEAQRQLLERGHSSKVSWAAGLEDIPPFRGIVISNEFLDALAVHVIEMKDATPHEVFVDHDGTDFKEILRPITDGPVLEYLGRYAPDLPADNYRAEVNLAARGFINDVSRCLTEGFVLSVDYGYPAWEYYAPERNRGTMLCYKGHRATESYYENIGRQDITAHVNFSAIKDWGDEAGLICRGFARQGVYLVSLGIDEAIMELYGGRPDYTAHIAQIHGLIMPGGLGDSHKVIVQQKGGAAIALRGFAITNQASRL